MQVKQVFSFITTAESSGKLKPNTMHSRLSRWPMLLSILSWFCVGSRFCDVVLSSLAIILLSYRKLFALLWLCFGYLCFVSLAHDAIVKLWHFLVILTWDLISYHPYVVAWYIFYQSSPKLPNCGEISGDFNDFVPFTATSSFILLSLSSSSSAESLQHTSSPDDQTRRRDQTSQPNVTKCPLHTTSPPDVDINVTIDVASAIDTWCSNIGRH